MTNDTIDPLLPPPGPMKIEYVYVDENPIIAKVRQTGHFGPFPMKNVGDKVFYGTGISYMAGYRILI